MSLKILSEKFVSAIYFESFVKGLAKTTAGIFVLFLSYPLFIQYDSYLAKRRAKKFLRNSNEHLFETKKELDIEEEHFSKLTEDTVDGDGTVHGDSSDLSNKIKKTLDELSF
jgi:hypothetical protein